MPSVGHRLGGLFGDTELAPRLGDKAIAGCHLVASRGGPAECGAELFLGYVAINFIGQRGPVREHGNGVVCYLDKAAIYIVAQLFFARSDSQLAKTEPADHRAMLGPDAILAILKRQHHEIGGGL